MLVSGLISGLVTALTGLLALTGCETDGLAGGGTDKREWTVAADPHATAAEIIDAGRPVDVAAGNDRTLVTYRVESDDDEGPQQGAWRLYDGQDAPLADGRLGQVREQDAVAEADAVSDGFLLHGYTSPRLQFVGLDGTVDPVTTSPTTAPAQAGDLLVERSDDAGPLVYRPAGRTAYRLPRIPFRDVQRVALDDRGIVWVLRGWTRTTITVAHSQGGAGPWQRTVVPSQRGDYPVGLVADHGLVVVPVAHGPDESQQIRALEVLDTRGPGSEWRAVDAGAIAFDHTLEPVVRVLDDGRLLVVGEMEDAWLEAPGGGFTRVDIPDDWASIKVQGDRWFATYPRGRKLWASTDEGRTWADTRLP